ncbi:MAG: glutathione S-transferase family protein [Pseudomonadota bacterium]|nr:MAG: glutathione S-transferase family protein [Pseudomonadota bacterium]
MCADGPQNFFSLCFDCSQTAGKFAPVAPTTLPSFPAGGPTWPVPGRRGEPRAAPVILAAPTDYSCSECLKTVSHPQSTPSAKPHLISFKLCPFVQRSAITLLYKNVDFDITYIDLADLPQWFSDISPLGKVPVLKVDGTVLFESAVINEYLDETSGGGLLPADPLQKALNRAWIEVGSEMIIAQYRMLTADTEQNSRDARDALEKHLQRIEAAFGDGPYFNGAQLSLVDTAYAPIFLRLEIIERQHPIGLLDNKPRLAAWAQTLLGLDAVRRSVVDDFESLFIEYFKSHGGWLGAQFGQDN